jgi:hypothetical protein
MTVSLTSLLIVATAVALLTKYWTGSRSTPIQALNLPASPARTSEKSNEFLLNRGYRCFAFLGLVTLPFGLGALLSEFGLMNFDESSHGLGWTLILWTMVLCIPIFVGMLYATVYGIRQTVRFRHRPLVVLSLVSLICWGGTMIFIAYSASEVTDHPILDRAISDVMGIGLGVYIAANVLIPTWWFSKGRRRYRSNALAQEKIPAHTSGA